MSEVTLPGITLTETSFLATLGVLGALGASAIGVGGAEWFRRRHERRVAAVRRVSLLLDVVRWSEACKLAALEGRFVVENRSGLRWGTPLIEAIEVLPPGLAHLASLLYLQRDLTEAGMSELSPPGVPGARGRALQFEFLRWHLLAEEFVERYTDHYRRGKGRRIKDIVNRPVVMRPERVEDFADTWFEGVNGRLESEYGFELIDGALIDSNAEVQERIQEFERVRRGDGPGPRR